MKEIINISKEHINYLEQMNEIYNHYVQTSTATFDMEPKNLQQRLFWLDQIGSERVWGLIENQKLIGFLYLQKWSDRLAYAHTSEITIYISPDVTSKGHGQALLDHAFKQVDQLKITNIISKICTESEDSLNFHRKNGFKTVGIMKDVGKKFDRHLDVEILQLRF